MAKRALSAVNSILNRVVSDLGLDKRLREHTFISLWPTFINSALAQRSRPLFFDSQRNLVVSVADAATGQELSMIKGKLLLQLQTAARSLSIDLRGLRLDLKHYHSQSVMPPANEPPQRSKPSAAQLSAVTLNAGESSQLDDLAATLATDESLSAQRRDKILMLFEKQLRLRRFMLKEGYPQCPACGEPAERLHRTDGRQGKHTYQHLCLTCLYSS